LKGSDKYTDEELVEGIRKKNSRILQHIVREFYGPVKKMVLYNSGNNFDSDEIYQESLVILYKKVQDPEFSLTSSLFTFFYSIARLKWLKELERRKKFSSISKREENIIDHSSDAVKEIEKNERLKLFREKYEELSEDCQKVLGMFLKKMSIAEITEMMGYSSEQHTRNRRYRCKESLIKKIKNSTKYKELGNENNTGNREFP